jgi:predicted TIM-barrel fold metal-dependent hydrolase
LSKNGFKVMDSDMHILEPADLWDRYMEPAYRGRVQIRNRYERDFLVTVDGKITNSTTGSYSLPTSAAVLEVIAREREGQNPKYQDAEDHGWDSDSQIRAMDSEGIDVAVLYPSRGLFSLGFDTMEPGLAAAVGRAYNDWMFHFCKEHPDRLYGAGHISPHDVEAAVSETRRCVDELGFKAVFLRPDIVNNRQWDDPYYNPLWAECQQLGIPLGFHAGGRPPGLTQVGDREFSTLALHHVYSHSATMMLAVGSFCGGGIFERFPELRVSFLEANCAWVPWLLWRLDEHYEWRSFDFSELTMSPSEYFKRQGFASVECDEWPAKYVDDAGYGHTVVFSTDYPHPDSKYPHAVESFLCLELEEETKRKYLWDNCARLYNL